MKATIILEDKTMLVGRSFGAQGTVFGELVFNTSMSGYQNIVSDPAYSVQILTMTYPEMGVYGINKEDFENKKVHIKGFICKKYNPFYSNFMAEVSLGEYFKKNNVVALDGIDTRSLVKKLRDYGTMACLITTEEVNEEMFNSLKNFKPQTYFPELSTKKKYTLEGANGSSKIKLACIDYGGSDDIFKKLIALGATLDVFPASVCADEILNSGNSALFLTDGAGDPREYKTELETVKKLIGKIPIYAMSFGCNLVGLALGATVEKLQHGHRGSNHPVINLNSETVAQTVQNHGYALDKKSLTDGMKITYSNLNDGTLEGFECSKLNIKAVQFLPDNVVPTGSEDVFASWIEDMEKNYVG